MVDIGSSKVVLVDLAIFGGKLAFNETLHIGRPNIGDRGRLLDRINDILDRRWLTNNGIYVQEFESKIAKFVGVKHCIAMCNATVALEIVSRALGMSDEVILPSMTFIATAHSLQWQQITPVFCDIDPETHNLDPQKVEELITPATTGIIGVHLWGRPTNIDKLTEIARKHHLKLLFDAAHAFGVSYQNKMIGGFGDAEVFSFHATKFVNSFEGGAVVTNDDVLAKKVRLMKNFGFEGMDTVNYIGINGKMSEISAAMGITSLESMEDFIFANRRNYIAYRSRLEKIPGITVVSYDETQKNNYHYIVLEINEKQAGISRDLLMSILQAENIRVRRYFYPGCHRMEPYRSINPAHEWNLEQTESVLDKILCLPNGTEILPDDVEEICQIIEFAVANAREIKNCYESLPINGFQMQMTKSKWTVQVQK